MLRFLTTIILVFIINEPNRPLKQIRTNNVVSRNANIKFLLIWYMKYLQRIVDKWKYDVLFL